MRRTSSNAAPAAARSTIAWPRSDVASAGGRSRLRPAAGVEREPTVQGSRTCRSSTCASSPRPPGRRSARPPRSIDRRRRSRRGGRGSSGPARPAPRAGQLTSSAGGPGGSRSTSRTTRTGRSGEPHTSASVRTARGPFHASGDAASRPGRCPGRSPGARPAPGCPARRAPAAPRPSPPPARRAARSRAVPASPGRAAPRAAPTAARPTSRGAGRRGCVGRSGHPTNSTGDGCGRALRSRLDLR